MTTVWPASVLIGPLYAAPSTVKERPSCTRTASSPPARLVMLAPVTCPPDHSASTMKDPRATQPEKEPVLAAEDEGMAGPMWTSPLLDCRNISLMACVTPKDASSCTAP